MMIAAGLTSASDGRILVDAQHVTKPRTDIGIVFQNHVLLDWRTALENVLLQAEARKMDMVAAEVRARELLAAVGLSGFENKYPKSLSGGMRQRVSICRALLHNPSHLLMDEPFGALDALTRDQLVLDLQDICSKQSVSILFVTHSIAEAVFLSDRVVVMTPRPGKVDKVIDIDLPRPRTLAMRESPEFDAYSREIPRNLSGARCSARALMKEPVMPATAALEPTSTLSIEQVERRVQSESRRKRSRDRRTEILSPILVAGGLLVAWEVAADFFDVPTYLFRRPAKFSRLAATTRRCCFRNRGSRSWRLCLVTCSAS